MNAGFRQRRSPCINNHSQFNVRNPIKTLFLCEAIKPRILLDLILKAVVTGFVLSVLIGPVFFLLLETSIRKGVRAALAFDAGVLLSDLIYIVIAYTFYAEVADLTKGSKSYIIDICGGVIFLAFGLVTLLKKAKAFDREEVEAASPTSKDYYMLGLKGFLLNFANPAVIFYWFSVIALGAKKEEGDVMGGHILLYITIILVTFFSVDVLKIIGAKKLRPFITERVLTGLNRLTGLIILITGVVLLIKGISHVVEVNPQIIKVV